MERLLNRKPAAFPGHSIGCPFNFFDISKNNKNFRHERDFRLFLFELGCKSAKLCLQAKQRSANKWLIKV
jgi:hypothetical protein